MKNNLSHGWYDIDVVGNTLIISVEGPANKDLFLHYVETVMDAKSQLSADRWFVLLVLRGMIFGPPDMKSHLVPYLAESARLGLKHTAICIESVCSASLVRDYWGAVYAEAGVSFEAFSDFNKAVASLESLGADLSLNGMASPNAKVFPDV